ncbi:Hypothetical predicted protein [Olea europaea subsp. europaea]|uniref:Uncharacterized protein n=1 Tax=Olea europaea subsp. europaea TaxID=158383 RepID=A0A8S0UDW0_OLEEU|nr:Hypothetical predicted protein [Olea europaea subsp. europaea]
MTCLICGLQGHNKRYHSRHDAPLDDWFEGELQQVGVQCNSYGTARGKMVVIGGKGASSVTHTAQNSPFHFMPAPTIKTDFATDCVALSPAITMPNLHQNERVHLVTTNVPTVEVNFEEKVNDSQHMDEVKMLKIQPKRTRTRRSANTA